MKTSARVTRTPQPAPSLAAVPTDTACPAATVQALYGNCAKRQSIIEAAEAGFAGDGFAAASIDAIACAAGVARQTVYNHYRDKETLFAAVVSAIAERANAGLYRMIASFPDRPVDLAGELSAFADRLIRNGLCNRDGNTLRRLIEAEGGRHPELFAAWRSQGPDRIAALLGARLAMLAEAGYLTIGDAELAARQLIALVHADIQIGAMLGEAPTDAEIASAARNGVDTFLRAFGPARG